MSDDFDIIVAGAGPAGLTAAKSASENGAEVLVLELQAGIGRTQASSWVLSDVVEDDLSDSKINEVSKVEIHTPHRSLAVEGDFGKVIDRNDFDKKLSLRAVKAGADIWLSSPVRGLLTGSRGIDGVRAESGEWSEEIESEVVIDATGARAEWSSIFLSDLLGSDWNSERTTQSNEYLMANVSSGDGIDLYFNSMLAPLGHAWVYPYEDGFAMTGIRGVRIHPDSALDEFIGRENPSRLEGSVPVGAYRGQLPVDGPLDSTVSDGILAVGSAAGQVNPFSGHGVRYALEAGDIAGRIAVEGVEEGDCSEKKLARYDKKWRDKFGKELIIGEEIQDSLSKSPDRKINALLEVMENDPKLAESFVNIFLSKDLEENLRYFFKNAECKEIVGEKRTEKILSFYS